MTSAIGNNSSSVGHDAAALGAFDDAMCSIYKVIADLREADVSAGQNEVAQHEVDTKRQGDLERQAIQQEQANAASSGSGFFSSLGDFVSDVAGDLVHGRLADAVDDAGHDVDHAWNSPKFWSDLEIGLRDAAAVIGAVSATVLTAGAAGVAVAGGVVAAVGAVDAAVVAGAALAHGRSEHFAANVEDASADATAARNRIGLLEELTSDVVAELKETDQSHQRSLQTLTQAIQTNDDAGIAPASMTVKG